MSMRVTFDLDSKDLDYFRSVFRRARAAAENADEAEIISKARAVIDQVRNAEVPVFVQQRIEKLESLIGMVEDQEWALASPERKNVLSALSYFAEPQDIIPDSVPVVGYLDDAIMIELVVRELQHEIEAFSDFCRYREEEKARNRSPNLSRQEFIDLKRRQLQQRMRRRRGAAAAKRPSRGSRPRFRLF